MEKKVSQAQWQTVGRDNPQLWAISGGFKAVKYHSCAGLRQKGSELFKGMG